jgi:choline/glycine/proline betaine transport protein
MISCCNYTLFGLATSLGMGVQQIAGLNHLWGIDSGVQTQIFNCGITAIATVSVCFRVDKGANFE